MNLIFRAFLFTQASFLGMAVLWYLLQGATSLPIGTRELLVPLAGGLGALMLLLGWWLELFYRRRARKRQRAKQAINTYYAGVNLRLATTNGTTLFFILLFGLSGDKRFLLGTLILFGVFVWLRPSLRRIQRELNLSESQVEELF